MRLGFAQNFPVERNMFGDLSGRFRWWNEQRRSLPVRTAECAATPCQCSPVRGGSKQHENLKPEGWVEWKLNQEKIQKKKKNKK